MGLLNTRGKCPQRVVDRAAPARDTTPRLARSGAATAGTARARRFLVQFSGTSGTLEHMGYGGREYFSPGALVVWLMVVGCGRAETAHPTTGRASNVAPAPAQTVKTCTPTIPPTPGLQVPGERAREHPVGIWYGTPALWTVLPENGDYGVRKSVWWSEKFGGGNVEEHPDISVVARRLDAPAAPIQSKGAGTNAFTELDGWFMIADFPVRLPAGCWEITARYKGASLSHVVEVR